MSVSLPHEREVLELVSAITRAYDDPGYLGVCITDTAEHARYLIQKAHAGTAWDTPDVRLFREGVEVKGGGRIVVMSAWDPARLRGMRPTEIIAFGRIGELLHLLKTSGAEVVAVA